MAETAALFVAYSSLQDVIRASSSRPRSDKLSIPELALAAAGAGFFTSFFLFVLSYPCADEGFPFFTQDSFSDSSNVL